MRRNFLSCMSHAWLTSEGYCRLCQGLVFQKASLAELVFPHILGVLAAQSESNNELCKKISTQVSYIHSRRIKSVQRCTCKSVNFCICSSIFCTPYLLFRCSAMRISIIYGHYLWLLWWFPGNKFVSEYRKESHGYGSKICRVAPVTSHFTLE